MRFRTPIFCVFALLSILALSVAGIHIDRSIIGLDILRFMLFGTLGLMGIVLLIGCGRTVYKVSGYLLLVIFTLFGCAVFTVARYLFKQKRFMQASDLYAILQSNLGEAVTFANLFLADNQAILYSFVFITTVIGNFVFLVPKLEPLTGMKRLLAAFACLICSGIVFSQLHPVRVAHRHWNRYYNDLAAFERNLASLEKETVAITKTGQGEILVLVIGESASRDFMQVYGMPVENTPWMVEKTNQPGWHLFTRAYSHHTHTVPTLSAALTEGRQITGLTYPRGSNIISAAKCAGIKTIWVSNQGKYGRFDSPVAVMAEQADTTAFMILSLYGDSRRPLDSALVPRFRELLAQVKPQDNALFVLHLGGSHWPYEPSYPEDFSLTVPDDTAWIGNAAKSKNLHAFKEYLHSLAYTDTVLESIHSVLAGLDRPVSMVYFSDHGEDVFATPPGHDFATLTWPKARIPMIVWLSEGYRERYPDKQQSLAVNKDRVFTNDLIFDLGLGLLDLAHPAYKAGFDPSSDQYALSAQEARMAEDIAISDDFQSRIEEMTADGRLALHRANTVFKAKQALGFGIRRLEMDLLYRVGKDGSGNLWVGHEEESMTGMDLAGYLRHVGSEVDFLWLDIKNMEPENAEDIAKILDSLDHTYQLRAKAMVESKSGEALSVLVRQGWDTSLYLLAGHMKRLRKNDPQAFQEYVEKSIASVRKNNIAGISYDIDGDEMIREYISPFIPSQTIHRAWNVDWYWTDKDILKKTEKYPHIQILLLALKSPFHY